MKFILKGRNVGMTTQTTFINITKKAKPLTIEDLEKAMELLMVEPDKQDFKEIENQMNFLRAFYGLKLVVPNFITRISIV